MRCSDGSVIELSQGELWVQKPNLFHWHVINPKEFFLISDGKTVWFYVPLIKQVTAYCLKNVVNNIIFRLLFDNDTSNWNDCSVIQEKNWFYLTYNYSNTDFKKCSIKITNCGKIERFIIYEEYKQCVDYILFNYNTQSIDINKFRFLISEDIQLDDQRS